MRVGITPYGGRENPYQYLTKRALEKVGCHVECFGKKHILPFRSIRRSGVDVVHMDWPHSFYCSNHKLLDAYKKRQFIWELKRLDIPLVWTVHNLARHNAASSKRDEFIDYLVQKASAIVSLSDVGREMIREAFPVPESTPVISIPHGHYASYYPNTVGLDDARASLSIPRGKPVALFMGRIQPYKGLEPLIDAYLQQDVLSEHQVVIAGMPISEQYADRLKSRAKNSDRIHFHFGFIAEDKLQYYFNAADYAVFPFSKVFNSGSVILALSFGIPVVTSKQAVLEEILPKNNSETFNNLSQFPQAIQRIEKKLKSPQERLLILKKTKTIYSWSRIAKRLMNLYENVTEK